MEECEALCNRLVIMIKGQLVCIGASQELKTRFGAGYDIHIKLNPSRSNEDVKKIKNVMNSSLTCDIRDENLVIIKFCLERFAMILLVTLSLFSFIINFLILTGFSWLSCN